jgi:hypothetical protein
MAHRSEKGPGDGPVVPGGPGNGLNGSALVEDAKLDCPAKNQTANKKTPRAKARDASA